MSSNEAKQQLIDYHDKRFIRPAMDDFDDGFNTGLSALLEKALELIEEIK